MSRYDKKRPVIAKKIISAFFNYFNRVELFIQLLRANSSTIFAEFSCRFVLSSNILSYIFILYRKRQMVHPNINSPSRRKGCFIKAFSFYPKLFNFLERFVLRFRTDRNDKQETKDVNHRKDPKCIGEPERINHHWHKLSDRPVCSP